MISVQESSALFSLLSSDNRSFDEVMADFTSNFPSFLHFRICIALATLLERSSVREFIVFVSRTIIKRTPPGQRQSVQHEEYKVHAYNRGGLCALGFMDDHYPVRSSFSLLNKWFGMKNAYTFEEMNEVQDLWATYFMENHL